MQAILADTFINIKKAYYIFIQYIGLKVAKWQSVTDSTFRPNPLEPGLTCSPPPHNKYLELPRT